jgi:hypothetical protein
MGLLDKLKALLSGGTGGGSHRPGSILDFYVRCDSCGETIHGQISLANDLSARYEGDDTFYFCRKGLVGSGETRCFQQVTVEYTFDARRTVIERRVEGGRFVDSPTDEGTASAADLAEGG